MSKSPKRGLAYDLASPADLSVLSPGVSWWHNWSPQPNPRITNDCIRDSNVEFVPMLFNHQFDVDEIVDMFKASDVKSFLALNEPSIIHQANITPQRAASVWPKFEEVAERTGAALVGPQLTWGTMEKYADPVLWLSAFYNAYRIDYLGFHWFDYGLSEQLDRLKKFGKKIWVTEMANWHWQKRSARMDSVTKQKTQCQDMVTICEVRDDVARYAWHTGRQNPDKHFTSLLLGNGVLSDLGKIYVSIPHEVGKPQ